MVGHPVALHHVTACGAPQNGQSDCRGLVICAWENHPVVQFVGSCTGYLDATGAPKTLAAAQKLQMFIVDPLLEDAKTSFMKRSLSQKPEPPNKASVQKLYHCYACHSNNFCLLIVLEEEISSR